jgi:hypothetical protein
MEHETTGRTRRVDALAERHESSSSRQKGRVILFAGQNFGEFNMLFNTALNFNDIKSETQKPAPTESPAR